MQRALTLIIAPAGYGKTTLVAAWAAVTPYPVAWLTMQSTDQGKSRFLIYLAYALQRISPNLGQTTLALLQSGGSHEAGLYALVNDLADLDTDIALVVDDYHSAETQETNDILDFLMENRPSAFHLILISRVTPRLNLSRLRVSHQVMDVTREDLRFRKAEASAFFETSMDVQMQPDTLEELQQSMEGWAAGLQLAALAITRNPEPVHVSTGQELMFNYIADEVLGYESPAVQDFLMITALFERFCAACIERIYTTLCIEPADRVAERMAYIERANLFLVQLDANWYRYHALFMDFLRGRLTPAQKRPILQAGSEWFEENQLFDEAIHYAFQAADFDRAANLLEKSYRDLLQRGEQVALKAWMRELPVELLQQRPRLWLAQGWASVIGLDVVHAKECAVRAEALLPVDDLENPLRSEAKILRILSGIFSGEAAATEEITAAFVVLAEQEHYLHSLLHLNLGLNHIMHGETAKAVQAFNETLRLSSVATIPLVAILAYVQMGETRQMRGALGLAERNFQQVICYAKETLGEQTVLLGMPYVSFADLLREMNRFDEAIEIVKKGIAYCHLWQPIASMDGHITLARILAAQGKWDLAFEQLKDALAEAETSVSVLDDTIILIHMMRLALLKGDLPYASQIMLAYGLAERLKRNRYYHLQEMIQLVLYRCKVAQLADNPAEFGAIIAGLSDLISAAESRERVTSRIEALLMRSYAFHFAADHEKSAADLSHALTLAAQGGYVRILADEGKQLLNLLKRYRSVIRVPQTYFEQILNVLIRENSASTSSYASITTRSLNPLTRRELDILRLLAAGKSNAEIAVECVLTVNTVKKHVANILAKLEAANRTQAVSVARDMGWLETK
ncbi:MAG: LuxR C-terminal-related transcriptional regulator [Bellilinea sp.]